jgi:probable rRNA maturation factor
MPDIRNDTDIPIPEADLETLTNLVLGGEQVTGDPEISVLFTDDSTTRDYNRRFRSVDSITDVLSFPGDWPNAPVLGDILINLEWVQRAENPALELLTLYLHGLLHLIGYDHLSARGAVEMDRLQLDYMEAYTRRG